MALTLECICSPDAAVCVLSQLVWVVDAFISRQGTIGALNILTLNCAGGTFSTIANPEGHYEIDLPVEATVENWSSLGVSLSMDASLMQVPYPRFSQYYATSVNYSIRQYYRCHNLITGAISKLNIISHTANPGASDLCEGGNRGVVTGGIGSIIYLSTPLGDCLSGALSTRDTEFQPPPQIDNTVSIGDSSQICLCATGGSGNYSYSIVSGELPCGITLNQSTGCLVGEANGDCPGTTSIVFRVTDSGSGGQSSTGGVTIGGTCRTFGSGVTRISGGAFDPSMVGNAITINGVGYPVATVTPPDLITVTGTIGIFNPTDWVYTSPVVAPPTPGPPETAEVTCGFIATCPTSDTGLGGNSAY